jgi:hypothetical protein
MCDSEKQNYFAPSLFKVGGTPHARYFAQRTREVPTVGVGDVGEFVPAPSRNPFGPAAEFHNWMRFLTHGSAKRSRCGS